MSYKIDDPLPRSRTYIIKNGTDVTAFVSGFFFNMS